MNNKTAVKCGCKIETHSIHPLTIECNHQVCPNYEGFRIVYCSMHEAAPEMLAILKRLNTFIEHSEDYHFRGFHVGDLITKAEVKP